MKHILIVTSRANDFAGFIDGLSRRDTAEIHRTDSLKTAIDALSDATPDLIVIDEEVDGIPGLKIARDILMKNAMVNQAVVSRLSSEEFHEASEGLGILAQLPPRPDAADAEKVIELLKKIS